MKQKEPECELDAIPVTEEVVFDEDYFYEEWRDRQAIQELSAENREARTNKQTKLSEVI